MAGGRRVAAEVDAALVALRRLRDPARQVAAATALLDLIAALEREVSSVRDDALRRLRDQGESYGAIATVSGLTRGRIAQLLRRTGDPGPSADPASS